MKSYDHAWEKNLFVAEERTNSGIVENKWLAEESKWKETNKQIGSRSDEWSCNICGSRIGGGVDVGGSKSSSLFTSVYQWVQV